jgi:hypothetical protein
MLNKFKLTCLIEYIYAQKGCETYSKMCIISRSKNFPSVSEVVDMKCTVRWGCPANHLSLLQDEQAVLLWQLAGEPSRFVRPATP